MKFAIISASHRQKSQSEKIATYIGNALLKGAEQGTETTLISLAGNPLPLWDESVWQNDPKWQSTWQPISAKLADSDGIVIVAPEWGGLIPAGLQNLLHFCGGTALLAHKPALIVGVSSSTGGAYPVAELRRITGKNTHICFMPDHIIVRYCEEVLNQVEPESDKDRYIRDRITYSLKLLSVYTKHFRAIRDSGAIDLKAYPFGM